MIYHSSIASSARQMDGASATPAQEVTDRYHRHVTPSDWMSVIGSRTSLAPSLALVLERAILIHCRFFPCYDFLMKDMQAQLDKLRADAAECALIRDLATDPTKRDLFTKLAEPYSE